MPLAAPGAVRIESQARLRAERLSRPANHVEVLLRLKTDLEVEDVVACGQTDPALVCEVVGVAARAVVEVGRLVLQEPTEEPLER